MSEGKITISRVSSNLEPDYIIVSIADEISGLQFASAKMSLENFALAISGLRRVSCELRLDQLGNVGKQRQIKVVKFRTDEYCVIPEKVLSEQAKDGWVPIYSDQMNTRNYVYEFIENEYVANVKFVRYVGVENDN